jgi:mono/diheme cytochrome c family protein
MRRRWKIAIAVIAVPVLGVSVLGAAGQVRWDRTFDIAKPDLVASTDPEVIARGRYIAYGPAHCAVCHTKADVWPALEAGHEPPLSGGYAFELPFGKVRSANLTPDVETGIGAISDGELARMLRHNVRHDGRAAVPFMEFQNMSDEDVVAVISFLRAQPAVRNVVPEHELNAVGKTILAFMIKPAAAAAQRLERSPEEAATVERGEYIASHVANCKACHSKRNMMDGSYIGEPFAGGGIMPLDEDPARAYVTPNLTPDSATGHIYRWTEDQFVARFRAGRVYATSHMPWAQFARMSDADLRATYRYLRSLKPVHNATGPLVQDAVK